MRARGIERRPDAVVGFGPFRLDPSSGGLWRGDERIHLRPKTWEVLCVLVANPGRLLSKDDLLDAVWGETAVGDTMPSLCVGELRRALRDDARQPRYVETVHGRGFRFIGELGSSDDSPDRRRDSKPSAALPLARSSFVGRQTELAALADFLGDGDSGCRVVLLSGDPGIGKTSLLEACLDASGAAMTRTSSPRRIVGWGHCLSHFGQGYPYLPILSALRSLCTGSERALQMLRDLAPSWLERLPELAGPGDLGDPLGARSSDSPHRPLDEMVTFLRSLGPAIWVLEDLHWADEATLELLVFLVENPSLSAFRVIASLRIAEAVGRAHPVTRVRRELLRRRRCREILLDGLSEADVEDFLAMRLDRRTVYPPWLGPRLHLHCNGNPFFLAHTVEHLEKTGALAGYETGHPDREAFLEAGLAAVPESLRDLVRDDIATLTEEERRVLADASLAGLEVDAATVAAASGAAIEASDTLCAELARRTHFLRRTGEAVWPDGTVSGRYAFRHAIYQKVLYDEVPPAARRASHVRIGGALVAGFAERACEIAPVIADHFERGGEPDRAVAYHWLAARAASDRHASREAAHHLESALRLVPRTSGDKKGREAEILAELGKVLPALQGFGDPALRDLYLRVRSLRATDTGAREAIVPLIGELLANLMQRRPVPAEEIAHEMLEMAAASGDLVSRGHAEVLMGAVLYHQGDLAGTIDHADRALALTPDGLRFGPVDQRCGALVMSGAALWQAGRPDAGLERAGLARQAAENDVHPFNRMIALQPLIAILQWRGEVAEALAAARELAASVREQGVWQAAGCAFLVEAWALRESGEAARALERIDEGLSLLRQNGTMMQTAYLLTVAVEVMAGLGRLDEASGLLAEAAAAISDGEARWWEPEVYRWRARLCEAKGGAASQEAEEWLRRAIELASVQSAASLVLRSSSDLAVALRKRGRAKEAQRQLVRALAAIEGGTDTRDVRRAQRLLTELSA